MIDALLAMGAPPDVIEATQKQASGETENDCEVWAENETVFRVFLALRRSWQIDGMSGRCYGLDRPAIESTLNMMGIKRKHQPEMLALLMIMEDAALPILNKKK